MKATEKLELHRARQSGQPVPLDLRVDDDGRPRWGYPTTCPTCTARGYLDYVDLVGRVMREHCPHCRTTWEVPEAACRPAS